MQNIYEVFEFYKIQDSLLEYAKTEIGRNYIRDLKMYSSYEEIDKEFLDLEEVSSLLLRFGLMPISQSVKALDIIALARKTNLLTPRDFSFIKEDILTSQNIAKYFEKVGTSYPRMSQLISGFKDLDNLLKEISRVITNSLTVADKASDELFSIRSAIKKAEMELNKKVMTLSSTYSTCLSDINATIRDGHYVLPVKTSSKSKVMGIVYDVSDSGNTTFIEPLEIVQINNEITSLKVRENEEVRKILKQLTNLVLLQEDEIIINNSIIGELDFLSSKALYGQEINGIIAKRDNNNYLDIKKGRHPLIDKQVVVANSFHLDKEKRIVIISGPNAGGKTVSLKTVGLLVLMHQCGLMVPAQEASIGFFNNIYIDIGDNQSLSDNLSTFSAHMSHIGEILMKCHKGDLVLLDELGTGTDPKEGEALALAITQELEEKEVLGMISSHFELLKRYAFTSKCMENSSMMFNEEELLPTYQFVLGLPGHSYAFEVAKRYGIDDKIIIKSKEYLDDDKNDISDLFNNLQKEMKKNEELKNQLEKEKLLLEEKNKKLSIEEDNLKNRKEHLLEDVEKEKQQIIDSAMEEVDEVIANLSKGNIKLHEAIESKKKLDDLKSAPETIIYDEEIRINDYVALPSLNMEGRVERIKQDKAYIISDSGFSFEVDINKLHKIENKSSKQKVKNTQKYDQLIKSDVGLELNIIGLRADEGKERLIKYIDDCRLKHFKTVRIIHGFGSGALRKMTHEYLSKQKDLTYRLGSMHEGGGGATVVEFK